MEKDRRLISAVLTLHRRCQEVGKGMSDAIRGSFSEVLRWNKGERATFVGESKKLLREIGTKKTINGIRFFTLHNSIESGEKYRCRMHI